MCADSSPDTAPCVLCLSHDAVRVAGVLRCGTCGWRRGDVPDADLPLPAVHIVYYLRYRDRVKIGTTHRPRQRLAAIMHEELLAFEPGDRTVERARHEQFASIREGGEWFTATPELLRHARVLRGDTDPWHAYARWYADAVARVMP